jgi:hypothetical protein
VRDRGHRIVRANASCEWGKVIPVLDAIVQANKSAPERTPGVRLVVAADRSRHTARFDLPRGGFATSVVRACGLLERLPVS